MSRGVSSPISSALKIVTPKYIIVVAVAADLGVENKLYVIIMSGNSDWPKIRRIIQSMSAESVLTTLISSVSTTNVVIKRLLTVYVVSQDAQ